MAIPERDGISFSGHGLELNELERTRAQNKAGMRSTQVKLVGFPFVDAGTTEVRDHIHYFATTNRCVYDVLALGAFLPGRYKFSLVYFEKEGKGTLTLTVEMVKNKKLGNEHIKASLSLDDYHYVSSGVVLCRDSVEEMQNKVTKLRFDLWGNDAYQPDAQRARKGGQNWSQDPTLDHDHDDSDGGLSKRAVAKLMEREREEDSELELELKSTLLCSEKGYDDDGEKGIM